MWSEHALLMTDDVSGSARGPPTADDPKICSAALSLSGWVPFDFHLLSSTRAF
jgi:hypothetical protein